MVCAGGGMREGSFSSYDGIMQRKRKKISPDSSFRIYSPNQTFNNNNNSFIINNNENNSINTENKINKKPIWNQSTRLKRMDPLLTKEVSMDVFSLAREIHTPIPPQSNQTEGALPEDGDGKNKALFKRNDTPDIKIYNLWSRHLSKDQVTAEAAWNRCRLITLEALDRFSERLEFLEEIASWEMTSEVLMDFQILEEKKSEIEAGLFEVEDYDIEIKEVAKATQNVAQFLAPVEERENLRTKIVSLRRRYFKVLQDLCRKKEIFRWLSPLLEQYKDQGSDLKSWLDSAETRTELIASKFNDNDVILKNEDVIEEIKEELIVEKDVYEDFLNSSEGILDLLDVEEILTTVQLDHDHVVTRWDILCSNIEKCINRLAIAKKARSEERQCKTDPEKIDKKIRNEAKQCTCHIPFQIKRVGEGKYTFGTSKLVRLVRVHGSSIVVRVGGGWEYLYDFLFKADPCRAKQAMESGSQEMKSLNLSGLDLTPIDKKSSNFNLNVTRMTPKSWTPYRNRYERSTSLGSAASSDNIDYDESSDSISLSNSTRPSTPSTPSSRPSSRIEYTPNPRKLANNNNNDSKLLGSLATMNSKNSKRLSLIERQAIYAEKKKVAQSYEDRKI